MKTAPINDRYAYVPGMSLLAEDQYRRDIAWIQACSPLSPEEERSLFARLLRASCDPSNQWRACLAQEARDRLVEAYQPMVWSVTHKVLRRLRDIELLDAVNEANIGLLDALSVYVKHWSPQYEVPFWVLAVKQMKWAIWNARYVRGMHLVPLSYREATLLSRMIRASLQFFAAYGSEPSVSDLATALSVSEEEVTHVQALDRFREYGSLQTLVDTEEGGFERADLTPLVPATASSAFVPLSPVKRLLRQIIEKDVAPVQRVLIERYYGFSDDVASGAALPLVAEVLGIDAHTAAKYEREAREKIAHVLSAFLDEEGHVSSFRDEWYSMDEVAGLLKMSRTQVFRYVQAGRLSVKRIGANKGKRTVQLLFPKEVVDALATSCQAEKQWYSTKEVACLLGVSCQTVVRRVEAGQLPVVRVAAMRGGRNRTEQLRFPKEAVDVFVSSSDEEEALSA